MLTGPYDSTASYSILSITYIPSKNALEIIIGSVTRKLPSTNLLTFLYVTDNSSVYSLDKLQEAFTRKN